VLAALVGHFLVTTDLNFLTPNPGELRHAAENLWTWSGIARSYMILYTTIFEPVILFFHFTFHIPLLLPHPAWPNHFLNHLLINPEFSTGLHIIIDHTQGSLIASDYFCYYYYEVLLLFYSAFFKM
jgi:hypothetical protein